MDQAMTEPQRTAPFAPFEWLLSGRYLRARRKEGFISVIAGFSFLGIMLGVATLIIVMAVMNGFRKDLVDKIVGLNGHLLVQPLESPLTDWEDVAERLSQVPGIRLAAPVVDGPALASSAVTDSQLEVLRELPNLHKLDLRSTEIGDLGVRTMRLLTNNPRKFIGLQGYGLSVSESLPLEIVAGEFSRKYLKTKKDKLGHKLSSV
jgi:hypothetical protein